MKFTNAALLAMIASAAIANAPEPSALELSENTELATVSAIPELMEAMDVSGLSIAVVDKDKILALRGFGTTADGTPYTSETSCGLYSATKVLASIAYSKLDDEGVIDLDTPLGEYISEAPRDWAAIPFYRLLNHSSGITMAVNKPAFGELAADPSSSNRDIFEMLRGEPLEYQPGEYSRYRQSGYAVGEMILQDRLDADFATLVKDLIANPAGMTSTRHPATSDSSQPALIQSAGGFKTTAQDMAKLFRAINSGDVIDSALWKQTILKRDHLMGDYSLGSVVIDKDGILTIGHSGGGARANVRYAPDEGIGVMVCTDDQSNGGLAIHLAQMLAYEAKFGELAAFPLIAAMKGYAEMNAAQVFAALDDARAQGSKYDLRDTEAVLTEVGYTFLYDEKYADAVDVLRFAAEAFPSSANAQDSLGEALLESGEYEEALAQYRRVLELDEGNEHAQRMIARIAELQREKGTSDS